MPKDAYYFSHDSNASRDPKCAALIADFGAEGYGLYWMIIETLSEQDGYKLEKFPKLYEGLAKIFQADVKRCSSIIQAMLDDYKLLLEDDKYVWSDSLLARMKKRDLKRLQKIEAGRIGGVISATKRKHSSSGAQAVLKQAGSETNQSKVKESKVNERILKDNKVNNIKVKENKYEVIKGVYLTAEETKKLMDQFGEQGFNERLNALSLHILSTGKKYDSHYYTILNWERRNNERNKPKEPDPDKYHKGKYGHMVMQ